MTSQAISAIHRAAAELVRQRGAESFSMAALAAKTGLSRATLYRHVKSREAVLEVLGRSGVKVEDADAGLRILEAARVVFTKAGFDAATLEDIAAAAGVASATLYRQFKDKRGLIHEFGNRFGPRRAMTAVASQPSGDVRADLFRLALGVVELANEDIDLMKLALIERLKGSEWGEVMSGSPFSSQRSMSKLMKHYVERGALIDESPERLARVFGGMLFSFLTTAMVEGSRIADPQSLAQLVTRAFLDGVSPRHQRPR